MNTYKTRNDEQEMYSRKNILEQRIGDFKTGKLAPSIDPHLSPGQILTFYHPIISKCRIRLVEL